MAPAGASASAKAKKANRVNTGGVPFHSFETLLQELATRCRNTCRIAADPTAAPFHQLTGPAPF
ncbi:MAG: hypothetical protein C0504_09250 [Candidatus Solibacter sp.]|nr:hypothetical protein [Candidatus Solibacter sp.]